MKTKEEILKSSKEELLVEFQELVKRKSNIGCYGCRNCYNCHCCICCSDCINCTDCSNCTNCTNCFNCSDCFYCSYLKNTKYAICNEIFTQKEYEQKIKEF